MNESQLRFYEFDAFLLDTRERLLFLDGKPLDLTPKVFDILLELVENSGRVVEKRELMERVWPEQFVEEGNLTQHISTLRKKLAVASDKQRYILTVPGRGYRFVAGVHGWDDDAIVTVRDRFSARIVEGDLDACGQALERNDACGAALVESSIQIAQQPPHVAFALPAPSRSAHARRRISFLAFGVVSLAVAFVAYKPLMRGIAPFERTKLIKFTTSGRIVCAAVSPDGKQVAYALSEAGQQSLWIRQSATSGAGAQVAARSEFQYNNLSFSPDGDYIYFLGSDGSAPGVLQRVPALGGTPVKLAEDVDSPPAFSPDGGRIAYVRGYPDQHETSLIIAGASGGDERKVVSLKEPREKFSLFARPSWSPDGRTIACGVGMIDELGERQELYEVIVEDGSLKPITRARWLKVGGAAWLSDGRGLVLVAAEQESALSQIWFVSYPEGDARKITNDLDDYKDLSLTADSRTLAVVRTDREANVWLAPEGEAARAAQITDGNYDGIDGLAWTPDGRVIYTTLTSGAQNLRETNGADSPDIQLTDGAGNNRAAAASTDGHSIAFVSARDGKQRIWMMDASGSHARRLTEGDHDTSPAFTPDGQWVVYRSYNSGNPNLFKIHVSGGHPVRLTDKISGPPVVSPDGKWIACTYREEALGATRLALISSEGEARPTLLDLKSVPVRLLLQWSRDARALLYVSTRGGVSNVWLQRLDGSAPEQLTDFTSDLIFNFALSNDGRRLALSRGQLKSDIVLIHAIEF